MFSKYINKTITIFLTFIFIFGIIPLELFSQSGTSFQTEEIKGFNRFIFDTHFSRADREITPERWLAEAKSGIMQVLGAWELIAGNLYDNPLLLDEAKNQLVSWSNEELEKRFSQWLIGRFFGEAAEKAVLEFSQMFGETQSNFSWHLDEEGNILFDDKTGNPLVIRPGDYGREFSQDLTIWKTEADNIVDVKSSSFENQLLHHYPELLAYIPIELRETFNESIKVSAASMGESIKREFENIAAREERIFTSRRTRDIWSLRRRSDDEAARLFTQKLIAETEESCKNGIEELNIRIEQAEAGVGDLAVMGEEWLRLYKEQFERGLKAWEEAEERFFIRRIEWEQDSFRLFYEGEEVWLSAFSQFEEQRRLWELQARELFQSGEALFRNISEDFEKNIAAAKQEFELNMEMRIGEGTTRVKALVDMYLACASAAISAMESIQYWQGQYGSSIVNPKDPDFFSWLKEEQENNPNNSTLQEIEKTYEMYTSYMEKALDARNRILDNYSELLGTGALKDILSSDATSDDFCLDEYQVALVRAKALVLYWEKKTAIAEAVAAYAGELTAKRITEAEGLHAWESAKAAYNESLSIYETELKNLNSIGADIQNQSDVLNRLAQDLLKEEAKLNQLTSDYTALVSVSVINRENYYLTDLNRKYNDLVTDYKIFLNAGIGSVYWKALEYGLIFSISDKSKNAEFFLSMLVNGSGEEMLSLEILEEKVLEGLVSEIELKLRLASIYFFSPNTSSADWYAKARGIELSEEEEASLFGKNLYNRLYEDYEKSYQVLLEKEIEFELLENSKLLEDAELDEDIELHEDPELYLEEFKKEFELSLGLLEMYVNYSPFCLFIEEELWQDSVISLAALFANYEITHASGYFPGVQEIYRAIIKKPGDYIENTIQFFQEVDNCFSIIPQWLKHELQIWQDAVYKYISAYAFNAEIFSENNPVNHLENDIHWRQYLLDDYITEHDSALAAASSWSEGYLEDSLYNAVYYTNRINDSFELFSSKNEFNKNENVDLYLFLYYEELAAIEFRYNSLTVQYNELANTARAFDFSKLSHNDIYIQLAAYEEALKGQEEIYNTQKNEYLHEANIFLNIGSSYDQQYKVLKRLQDYYEQKHFEYEKQDAIQRWASTAYLGTDLIDLENSRAKLSRAQTVLDVLSDLYNNESRRTYNNSEYDILYSAYEQSFSRKINIMEVYETVFSSMRQEEANNNIIYDVYKTSLNQFGYFNYNYANYTMPSSFSDYTIMDIVTVKDGRLAFTRDDSMTLTGLDLSDAKELDLFLNSQTAGKYYPYPVTQFEESLIGLSERMTGYSQDRNNYTQWGLAREYLLMTLIKENSSLSFLNTYSIGLGEVASDGSVGKLNIKSGRLEKISSLYSYLSDSGVLASLEDDCRKAWDALSEQEKADLEFYTIITLNNPNNNYIAGFSHAFALSAYEAGYNQIKAVYDDANHYINIWFFRPISALLSMEAKDVNGLALENIRPPYDETKNLINRWINGLEYNHSSILNNTLAYMQSNENLSVLEGILNGQNIEWENIYDSLIRTNKVNINDLANIESWWKEMRLMQKDSNITFKNVQEALSALHKWAENEEIKNKRILEEYWYSDSQNQQKNENIFNTVVDAYLAGNVNINELRTAALNAYGPNVSAWKNHVENLHTVMLNNLSMYLEMDSNPYYEFSVLGDEITSLTKKIMENRYKAEFTAREAEWTQTLKNLTEKYNEWQASAALILENGRTDWITSRQKIEDAYHQWIINFQNEFNRVNDEWNIVYLAGLEDKEQWLEQAGNAANQAAAESFLLLAGTEGERLARFMDTREPFGIRDSLPQTQTLMAELIQSSGIVNMSNAFNSLNNITGTASAQVRRGMGGISTWDTALVKTAAADLAKQINAETANNEIRKLAYNARLYADEAIRGLAATVDSENQNFRERMDDLFIFSGLWRKNGDVYVKDVLKGSTLFSSIISETVTVMGYEDYVMDAVTLQTNLDENYLASFDSIVIMDLLNNAINEVSKIAGAIFGHGEDLIKISSIDNNINERYLSPGLFGVHIGYNPDIKSNPEGKDKSSIFNDYGSGQLGRLITEFTYWKIIDNAGNAELALAPWDKRMWDDEGSWFSAPSLRSAGQIAASVVVGVATGGAGFWATLGITALVGSSSEILFGALDLAFEYKTFDKVALNVGKSIATSAVSGLTSGLFNGINDFTGLTNIATGSVTGTINDSFSKVLTQSVMKGVETTVSGLTTSSINAITYNKNNGWGYNTEIFKAGTEKLWINSLSSMASTFTTTGLQTINSGWNLEKLEGFSNSNKHDLSNFNKLAGSFAGQGVNYLFGEDFTLNVLNTSLFTNKGVPTGLVEVRFNNDGAKSQFGTGGANVSIDNIASSLNGLSVWNVNTNISSFKNSHDSFDSVNALRALYGYGQDKGNSLLWEIIKGETVIDTGADEDYRARTTRVGDKKVIQLTNYQQNMSKEEQMLLAITLLHEANRDGEITADNYLETRTATQAHTEMALRMFFEGQIVAHDTNIAMDIVEYMTSFITGGNMDSFYSYVDDYYDSSEDFWKLTKKTDGTWFWADDKSADFDITDLLNDSLFRNINSPQKSYILNALGVSNDTDGKNYGVISADRMSTNLALTLQGIVNYGRPITSALSSIYTDTIDKMSYNSLYTTTIRDSQSRPITFFNIDSMNDTQLVKQTDFRGINGLENLVNYGCNFMLIIGIPQLLTRQEFSQEQIVDLWNSAIEKNIINENGFVMDRSELANLSFQQLGITNIGIRITDNLGEISNLNGTPSLVGYRQQMAYTSSSGYEGSHYVLTSIYQSLVYNGSYYWNDDEDKYNFLGVWAYAK